MVRRQLKVSIVSRSPSESLSETKLGRYVRKILKVLRWKRAGISIVLVNDREMRRLHLRFMGRGESTDVLAFSQREGKAFPKQGIPFLGDVAVSVDTARRMAPRFGNDWQAELLLYICHGILHLMGWRDSTPRLKAQMDRKQEAVLNQVIGSWRSKRPKRLF